MESKRLDLISCHKCKKVFKDKEEGYQIGRIRFDEYDQVAFEIVRTLGVTVESESLEFPGIRRVIRFHEKCFQELAGTELMA